MKPVQFRYSNKILQPSGKQYSGNIASVDPLPIWTDDEQCVSCWQMSLRERLSTLIFGRVWIAVLSGGTQPAVYLTASRSYLQKDDNG